MVVVCLSAMITFGYDFLQKMFTTHLVVLQEKRDATAGAHIKDKCRCTMMDNVLFAVGLYTKLITIQH